MSDDLFDENRDPRINLYTLLISFETEGSFVHFEVYTASDEKLETCQHFVLTDDE